MLYFYGTFSRPLLALSFNRHSSYPRASSTREEVFDVSVDGGQDADGTALLDYVGADGDRVEDGP